MISFGRWAGQHKGLEGTRCDWIAHPLIVGLHRSPCAASRHWLASGEG